MQFVDEENDLSVGILHFLQHRLEPFFKLAAKLRPRDQRAHIERHNSFLFQSLRHIATDDALGESFHNRRLAHARFANQHRIILGAPRENLNHPPDLLIPPNHRIQLARRRALRQIPPVLFQRLVGHLRVLRSDPLAAANFTQGLHQPVAVHPQILQGF